MGKQKITKSTEIANGFPLEITVEDNGRTKVFIQKENDFFHCYQFVKWLELHKKGIPKPTVLLREYFNENNL